MLFSYNLIINDLDSIRRKYAVKQSDWAKTWSECRTAINAINKPSVAKKREESRLANDGLGEQDNEDTEENHETSLLRSACDQTVRRQWELERNQDYANDVED